MFGHFFPLKPLLLNLCMSLNSLASLASLIKTGVEQLSSLQHLDLAYNILLEHSQLAPLSLLHCLNTVKMHTCTHLSLDDQIYMTLCYCSQ